VQPDRPRLDPRAWGQKGPEERAEAKRGSVVGGSAKLGPKLCPSGGRKTGREAEAERGKERKITWNSVFLRFCLKKVYFFSQFYLWTTTFFLRIWSWNIVLVITQKFLTIDVSCCRLRRNPLLPLSNRNHGLSTPCPAVRPPIRATKGPLLSTRQPLTLTGDRLRAGFVQLLKLLVKSELDSPNKSWWCETRFAHDFHSQVTVDCLEKRNYFSLFIVEWHHSTWLWFHHHKDLVAS